MQDLTDLGYATRDKKQEDLMKLMYTSRNRSLRWADNLTNINTSVSDNGHLNIFNTQRPPQNKCEIDRHHKDASSTASLSPSTRGSYIPSSSYLRNLYKSPAETETDAQYLHQSRQNNSCYCGTYPDLDFGRNNTERISQALMRSPRSYDPQYTTYNSTSDWDLNRIYAKIKRLLELRQLSPSPGCGHLHRINEKTKSPSVLSRKKEPPHTRNLRRVQPYKRHEMYQRIWKVQPAIGDNFRFPLRQKVRQKMLRKDGVQIPHKMFVPNLYTAPPEKPRYNLRWIVRECNNNYTMPPRGSFHEV